MAIVINDPLEKLLDDYPPRILSITRQLRRMIKGVMPAADESIYHGAFGYSLSQLAKA